MHLPPNLPPLSPDETRALAWVRANVARDPDLAAIFDHASHTSWKPLIDFVGWAHRRNLLASLPPAPCGSHFRRAPAPQAGHPAFDSAAAQDSATPPAASPSPAPLSTPVAAESKAARRGVRGVNDAPAGVQGAAPLARGSGTASPLFPLRTEGGAAHAAHT
jgi:hypothetical protein